MLYFICTYYQKLGNGIYQVDKYNKTTQIFL